jgi:hypothetical protein
MPPPAIGKIEPVLRSTHDTVVSAVWALHRLEANGWWGKQSFSAADTADLLGVTEAALLGAYISASRLAQMALPMDSLGNIDGNRVRTEALLVKAKDFDTHLGRQAKYRELLTYAKFWKTGKSGLDPMRRIPISMFLIHEAWRRTGMPQGHESFDTFCSMTLDGKLELIPWLQGKNMKSGIKAS